MREMQIGAKRIRIEQSDITEFRGDAIVNSANHRLLMRSGVASAISKKGGSLIQAECNDIGPIPIGEAAITGAGKLAVKYVIHAASMGDNNLVSEDSLRSAVLNSLKRAEEKQVKTVAFPAVGTGAGGFPMARCAEIMLSVTADFLKNWAESIEEVTFVLLGEKEHGVFEEKLGQLQLESNK